MRILIATAHPDDLENGMGGLLTKLVRAGHEIISVVATLPEDRNASTKRAMECLASKQLSGIRQNIYLYHVDGKLEASHAVAAELNIIFETHSPDAVFTLWPVDVHPDHRAIASLAIGPALQRGVNTEILCFEVCSSGRASQDIRPQTLGFYPTHYADISDVFDEKKALVFCHESQDPAGMWRGVQNMMIRRGEEGGYTNAEGFVRLTRFGPLHPELQSLLRPTPFVLPRGIGPDFSPGSIGL